ncbi:MAG: hypothetical protein K2P98_00700, partial [Neisseriaceae bacterium]|nr:hypothetical protein [Neisseriaceae bacterium]
IFLYPSQSKKPPPKRGSQARQVETSFTSPVDSVDQQQVWLERAENRLSDDEKSTGNLQKTVEKQVKSTQMQQDTIESQRKTIDDLNQKYNDILKKMDSLQTQLSASSVANQNRLVPPSSGDLTPGNAGLDTGMQETVLDLAPVEELPTPPIPKTPDNYVPAGSYVQAVLIGGLDASSGVSSQSDPRPVLLRTIDNGTLPNNFHSRLKNCRIIGAGYGDISSERAYVRLERMSCWRDGEMVDYPIYGYVSGPDGKDGVRGRVVMRDGALVGRAFLGGLASGLGESVSNNYTETSISPLGSTTSVKNGESLQYGAAQGVSNAADMYARYNIKRAEQYQPVIEVEAGTVVDVVFNEGFYLDGKTDKQHEQDRKKQADSINSSLAFNGNPYPTNANLANSMAQLSQSQPPVPFSNTTAQSSARSFP